MACPFLYDFHFFHFVLPVFPFLFVPLILFFFSLYIIFPFLVINLYHVYSWFYPFFYFQLMDVPALLVSSSATKLEVFFSPHFLIIEKLSVERKTILFFYSYVQVISISNYSNSFTILKSFVLLYNQKISDHLYAYIRGYLHS
jgi:hypothetical protein